MKIKSSSPADLSFLVSALIALAVFTATIILVFVFHNSRIDDTLFGFLKDKYSSGSTRLMLFFTFLGTHIFLIPANLLLLTYFLLTKNKWWAIRVASVSLSSLLLMSLFKNLFQRHRPSEPLVQGITNYSFPSGHAMMSIAFYGLLILLCAFHVKNRWIKKVLIAILLLFIIVIGFSRIYLRVHYTTDVLAGFSFGLAWLLFCFIVLDKLENNKNRS
jgi:undecaprenyl-diphosphatase